MMFIFRFIKSFIVGLYKGLIYWFFWASSVSMRDELFCSYTFKIADSKYEVANSALPPLKTVIADTYDLLALDLQDTSHPTQAIIASYMAHALSNLCALAASVKDLPEKHRARLRFCSD
ncbi:MAG TPA: hypothetical protein PK673_03430 [Paludibacteraceae bacterium]|nr:hypothetical protein [Paludibacteraceae bacterium]HPD27409.1 hypothetical protein [Paludibacteraceae bacterium]HRR58536.1 hypothetical protein [Paludibacteraceae bacterium]HRU71897.1 hypothetical protein [Paludibacteraceae bacterium]